MNRGEIWLVQFDPSIGDEIQKFRAAVIIGIQGAFHHRLQIVVPITTWQPKFQRDFWHIRLPVDTTTNLLSDSSANASQVKSVSELRFKRRTGQVSQKHLIDIIDAVAFCIGYPTV